MCCEADGKSYGRKTELTSDRRTVEKVSDSVGKRAHIRKRERTRPALCVVPGTFSPQKPKVREENGYAALPLFV